MLTDDQWSVLEPLFQKERTGAGRPQIHSDREVLNGVLWVLRTGAAWADLPDRFPSSATCYRRFSKWVKDGRLRKILESLARHLEDNGLINLEECFIDGTFVVAKKGAQKWERPSGAKVRSSWLLLTLLVYLSPCTRILLTLMKSDLSRLQSMKLSRWDAPEELLGIVPMTAIRLMKPLLLRELNSSRRTARIVKSRRRKTDGSCAVTKEVCKDIVYISRQPVIIFVLGLGLSLAAAWLVQRLTAKCADALSCFRVFSA